MSLAAGLGGGPTAGSLWQTTVDRRRSAAGDVPARHPRTPSTLPIFDDNQPIADGLEPEDAGVLKVLNYEDYMAPGVMKDFEEEYGAEVQVTPYNNYDEMLNKTQRSGRRLRRGLPWPERAEPDGLRQVAAAVQPDLPDQPEEHLARVPRPLVRPGGAVHRSLHRLHHGRWLPRRPRQRPVRGLQDDLEPRVRRQGRRPRRLRRGAEHGDARLGHHRDDINTGDPAIVNAAKDKLIELIDLVDVKIGITQYETIAERRVHGAPMRGPAT